MLTTLLATLLATLLLATVAPRTCMAQKPRPDAAPPSFGAGVYVGYQGWFHAEGDGTGLGFRHYGRDGRFEPGFVSVDYWPDLSGFDDDERYATPFRHQNGTTAHVFSSANPKTVARHFEWMREHGIDGAFVQRFGASLRGERMRRGRDRVLANVRRAAARSERAWALMYDLSGLREAELADVVAQDFRRLSREGVFDDPRYLHLDGRPLVAVWGVGFDDGRAYSIEACSQLVDVLHAADDGARAAVMLGVPHGFRTGTRDAVTAPELQALLAEVEVLSPWAVGRLRTPTDADRGREAQLEPDLAWCRERGVRYLPVVFPGFSWHNLRTGSPQPAPLDQIPRLGGTFLWRQALAARRAGAEAVYVAMFDEIDEGTAILPVHAAPPVGASPFLTYGELPPDHYLWLTGRIGELMRSPAPAADTMPVR